ncbi:16S rRNA (guanine(527)-N(7))-methyltransferase RsmG [Thiohalobacter sp. IOR34]|uniref:16S rRNA (guanine(527)-N(7))-methyltransferase RsmG n=1 Tax=Thiohalobacter sp. IOR34 TaxID=3057176 RepID=UPI0025B26EF1|nr:16S rRNA (guanine(527)-N(7))-methyltransferase RsmG [Thiohalobacter sp. IOR34]WJW75500.1 16S rRNA (guanine(527)-N(7))-methyltransferase RsmG [Thiohalobacter sp. IOR34]
MAVFAKRINKDRKGDSRQGQNAGQRLAHGLEKLDLGLDDGVAARLMDYVQLLTKWNRVYNLTSVRKPQDMVARHILDSLVVLPYLEGPRLLDIGTGAGLPGMVLAIARPDWEVVMLDSSNKKLRFVRQAVAELGLDNASVEHVRLEDYRPAQPFDSLISRAFSSLQELHEQGRRLCTPAGRIHAMKGVYPVAEMEVLTDPDVVEDVLPLRVPGLDAERHLVIMKPD